METKGKKTQSAMFVSKFPRLAELLRSGDVAVEGPDYVGLASDGTVVSLGQVVEPLYVERYLAHYPTPDKW